uniref:Uncharacterized protein n=1 Tax=Romanomermis culicivorax TaxID=13658 RepID=A0A915HLC2_ROMCU
MRGSKLSAALKSNSEKKYFKNQENRKYSKPGYQIVKFLSQFIFGMMFRPEKREYTFYQLVCNRNSLQTFEKSQRIAAKILNNFKEKSKKIPTTCGNNFNHKALASKSCFIHNGRESAAANSATPGVPAA